MKKFVCILVAMMLCLSAVAMAESVPSKTTADMTWVKAETEVEVPAGVPAPVIDTIASNPAIPEYQETVAVCETVLEELVAAVSTGVKPVEFFGEVKNNAGEAVKIEEVLGTKDVKVSEFVPLFVENYDPAYKSMTAKMTFATAYKPSQKVVMLVGIVKINADGTQSVEWISFEGIGQEDGSVEVTFDAETLMAIQNGTAMMAALSE